MRSDNTDRLRRAARNRSEQTRSRAVTVLGAADSPMTVAGLAAAAGVSRSWIYTQPELLEQITVTTSKPQRRAIKIPDAQRASTASLQRRLELAHDRNRQLAHENSELRNELALAYGRLRTGNHGD